MSFDWNIMCSISGALFFLIGLLLGRRWKPSQSGGAFRQQAFRKPAFPGRPPPPRKDGPVEIYVGNLSTDVTREELEQEFGRFGKVINIRLITKHGESKSFGFVEMAALADAEEAIKALAGKEFKSNPLEVNIAKSPRGHRRHRRH